MTQNAATAPFASSPSLSARSVGAMLLLAVMWGLSIPVPFTKPVGAA